MTEEQKEPQGIVSLGESGPEYVTLPKGSIVLPVPLPDGSDILADQHTDESTITIMLDGVFLRKILAHWNTERLPERLRTKLSSRDVEVPHD